MLKDGATVTGRLGVRSIRSIIAKRAAAAAGRVSGHSLRVGSGSAPRSRSQQPAPVWSNCRKRAIGKRRPCRRTLHATNSQHASPSPSFATRRAGSGAAQQGSRHWPWPTLGLSVPCADQDRCRSYTGHHPIVPRASEQSLRVGSARELAADVAELQQAGAWKSPTTIGVYIRREAAAHGPVARCRYKVGA